MTDLPDAPLPAVSDDNLRRAGLPTIMEMSPGLAIFFDDALYARCKNIASMMARGDSMTPKHLRNKPEACFAVVSISINWKMNPMQVARSTYETPGENIGYEGKLIQAILELSGRIDGQIRFEHKGDWSKVRRKFAMKAGKSGGEYPVPTWTAEDADGLYVTIAARLKGEEVDRTLDVYLDSCWPLNSPLWATDPRRQICYFGIRAFANLATPTLLFGIPFDVDPAGLSDMVDITPKPQASEFTSVRDQPQLQGWITKANFANTLAEVATLRKEGLEALPEDQRQAFEEVCDARGRQIAASAPVTQEEENAISESAMDEMAAQQEGSKPEDHGKPKPATKEETPFQRGVRLLGVVKAAADVRDVLDTISEELRGKELKLWKDTCQARYIELGGVGKMKTAP